MNSVLSSSDNSSRSITVSSMWALFRPKITIPTETFDDRPATVRGIMSMGSATMYKALVGSRCYEFSGVFWAVQPLPYSGHYITASIRHPFTLVGRSVGHVCVLSTISTQETEHPLPRPEAERPLPLPLPLATGTTVPAARDFTRRTAGSNHSDVLNSDIAGDRTVLWVVRQVVLRGSVRRADFLFDFIFFS